MTVGGQTAARRSVFLSWPTRQQTFYQRRVTAQVTHRAEWEKKCNYACHLSSKLGGSNSRHINTHNAVKKENEWHDTNVRFEPKHNTNNNKTVHIVTMQGQVPLVFKKKKRKATSVLWCEWKNTSPGVRLKTLVIGRTKNREKQTGVININKLIGRLLFGEQ